MAVRTRQEIMDALNVIIGERNDDEALEFIADVTDTLSDFENRSSEDWRQRYEDNDREWRQRYRDRFFNEPIAEPDPIIVPIPEPELKTFEDLFKEED